MFSRESSPGISSVFCIINMDFNIGGSFIYFTFISSPLRAYYEFNPQFPAKTSLNLPAAALQTGALTNWKTLVHVYLIIREIVIKIWKLF